MTKQEQLRKLLSCGWFRMGDNEVYLSDIEPTDHFNGNDRIWKFHFEYEDEQGVTWTTKIEDTQPNMQDSLKPAKIT